MIDDERARIPFAVIGILLLVSSATIATTMGTTPVPDEPAVDVVVDRVEAEQRTALRRSVRSAAGKAANNPVIEPANTSVGRALGRNTTFERSLRLRTYVAARNHLETVERRRGDVVATTSLPPVDGDDAASVRAAIERVHVESTVGNRTRDHNGTAITVEIHNVTTTVRRGDRVLQKQRSSPRVTVATPVLALHDRVSEYERRLNAGVTRPGLEQRLTVLMNAAGWLRGHGQYRGLPIDNVISNEHVEVATNAALLDVQRSTIGRVDGTAVEELGKQFARLAANDVIAMKPNASPILQQVIADADLTTANEIEGLDVPSRSEPMTVGINRSAEDVFLLMVREYDDAVDFLNDEQRFGLGHVLNETYSADAKLATKITAHSGGPPSPSPPGQGWTKLGTDREKTVSVTDDGSDASVGTGGDWHAFDSFSRRVVTEYEATTTWVKDGEQTVTTSTSTERKTITVTLLGRHAAGVPGPGGPISAVHENGGGPLSGPNLAGVEAAARQRLITDRGGRDAVARKAMVGMLGTKPITIKGERPAGLRNWVYRDLRSLRETVYDINVTVDRRNLATFAVNPPRKLKSKLASRRVELLDASPPYDGVADRARVAARAKYLDLVSRAQTARAKSRGKRRGALSKSLDEADAGSIQDLQQSAHATVDADGTREPTLRGPGGPVRLDVDAAPAYLETTKVTQEKYPSLDGSTHPLKARNFNVFNLPYGDVFDGFLKAIFSGPKRTSLSSAAQTLASSQKYGVPNETSRVVQLQLEQTVKNKVDNVERTARKVLKRRGVGSDAAERRDIVSDGLSKWQRPADRAFAISNGSAVTGILQAADEHTALSTVERDRLGLELDRSIRDTLEKPKGRPRSKFVKTVAGAVKTEATPLIHEAASKYEDKAVKKLTKGKATTLPSGLPVAPVPGYWYVTTNIWHIEAHGEYARFTVRTSRGRPTEPGSGIAYTRDGGSVRMDVDGDGSVETLGRSRRVQFSASVGVVVVVPPGPQGVGDVGGPMNELSPGWKTR